MNSKTRINDVVSDLIVGGVVATFGLGLLYFNSNINTITRPVSQNSRIVHSEAVLPNKIYLKPVKFQTLHPEDKDGEPYNRTINKYSPRTNTKAYLNPDTK